MWGLNLVGVARSVCSACAWQTQGAQGAGSENGEAGADFPGVWVEVRNAALEPCHGLLVPFTFLPRSSASGLLGEVKGS